MQADDLKRRFYIQDVKETLTSVGCHVDTSTVRVLCVENTALEVTNNLSGMIFLLLVNL